MSTNLDQLTADAMKLPLRDRVQLAQRLVSTIDDEVETDTEALWFAEAERRLEELRSGKVQGIPAEDVFRNARASLSQLVQNPGRWRGDGATQVAFIIRSLPR